MNKKNDTRVTIGGKTYNIAGYENVEYLQRIAAYLNKKADELKLELGYNIINDSEKNILMQINIADDYLKLKDQQAESFSDADGRLKEISSLKREVVALQTKLEAEKSENEERRKENVELQKRIVKLETELQNTKKTVKKETK
ncbi:MAG: cell division protein ZapA [Lachnospiraceae bacterium]|nr:cell division protein ZapA [Lachnospiraceae bacterium]